MNQQDQKGVGVRAADVELPPSMVGMSEFARTELLISDEGDELVVRRFDTAPQAAAHREAVRDAFGGEVKAVIVKASLAIAAPALLDYCRRRLARLNQLAGQHHKHSANRLSEKAELDRILAGLIDPDPREGGVDATGNEGGAA